MYLITFPTSYLSYLHVQMNMGFPKLDSTIPTRLCTAWTVSSFVCPRKHDWSEPGQAVPGWQQLAQSTPQRGLASATALVAPAWKRTKSRKVSQNISSSLY